MPPPTKAPTQNIDCHAGRTIVIVRHAEKAEGGNDPPLSPRGERRAKQLAALLAPAHVTRLVASEYRRTQQTLAPLASANHLAVEVMPAGDTTALAAALQKAKDGSVTVVACHSNTVPEVVRKLGSAPLAGLAENGSLDEHDYDRLVVLTFGCGDTAPIVVELHQPSPDVLPSLPLGGGHT